MKHEVWDITDGNHGLGIDGDHGLDIDGSHGL